MPSPPRKWYSTILDLVLCVCICFLYAGTPTPDVNESHYLTKARHFWMEAYGANDLFLGSADAHWFFFTSIGWLTSFFDLPTAAWIGRGIVWSLIAFGWYHLVSAVQNRPLLAPLALPPFLCAIELGHVSGEWVVGGFEAKGIAYALIFLGLGDALRWRWDRCWWWMGLASAFHVVVGAWVTLTLLISMVVLEGRQVFRLGLWTKQCAALVGGGCLALAGLIPAIQLNLHVPKEIAARAAKIYVYDRLPHHLSPLHFAWDRWFQHSVWLLLVMVLFLLFAASAFSTKLPTKPPERVRSDPTNENQGNLWRTLAEGSAVAVGWQIRLVWIIALIASLFAIVAIGIDMLGVHKPEWSASLLRFYWFRWNDVSWPLAVTVTLLTYRFVPLGHPRLLRAGALLLLTVPSSLWLADRFFMQWEQVIPEADVRSLLMENESSEQELTTYRDWLAVCAWIREETPEDSLWLTPRYQQTFPWYALRAEVVNWKNVPQDAEKIVEWSQRMRDVYRYTKNGGLIPPNASGLQRLGAKYGAGYALVDRRIYFRLPNLQQVYPNSVEKNQTYVVYKLSSDERNTPHKSPSNVDRSNEANKE